MSESMSAQEFLYRQGIDRPKDAGRQIRGKSAHAKGKSFEAELDQAHAVYLRLGMAAMDRLPVPTNPMPRTWLTDPKRGGIARILAEPQGFDFYGTLGPNATPAGSMLGRAVAMEAKASQDFKTSLGVTDKGPLRPHQLEALATRARDFGTITALVWRNGDQRGVLTAAGLIDAWQQYRLKTRKSVPWSAMTPYRLRALDESGPIEDWLSVALATGRAK